VGILPEIPTKLQEGSRFGILGGPSPAYSMNPRAMHTSSSLLHRSLPSMSTSFPSSSSVPFKTFEQSIPYDEDALASQYTEWPQWIDMDCHFAPPISSARFSIECNPPMPNEPELPWPGKHAQQYNLCCQGSPQSLSDSYEHVPLPYLQPHMHKRIRATQKPSASTTATTLYQISLPDITTVSPHASSASDSTSSSPSPLSTPEVTIRTPITVHQPRPSRRIPIVSLSELASACDDFAVSPTSKDASHQKPSRELLSPLTTTISAKFASPYSPMYSFTDEMGIEGASCPVPFAFEGKSAYTAPTHLMNDSEELVICSCGCMASYTLPQNSI